MVDIQAGDKVRGDFATGCFEDVGLFTVNVQMTGGWTRLSWPAVEVVLEKCRR